MSWDIGVPSGTDQIRNGDDVIRELKVDIQTALKTEGIFPGPTPATPIYHNTPLRGTTGGRPASATSLTGRLYINTTTNAIERDNGTSFDPVATLIPVGTKMAFFQATAPVGWTQDIDNDDALLRVVNTPGGGTGGADSIGTPPTHIHASATHTHSILTQSTTRNSSIGFNPFTVINTTETGPTAAIIDPTTAFAPKFVDMIICTKD